MTYPGTAMANRLKILLVEQAARTSNEWEVFAAMRDVELTVVSDRGGWGADREIVLPVARVPFVGGHEAWTMAPAWFRHLDERAPRDLDAVVSLEVFSFSTLQASMVAAARG